MDAVSYSKAAQQAARIGKIINEPDATSGLVTLPSTIAVGETITIPAGRTVVHPNLQVDGTLDVQGTLFIPSGGTYTADELDVTVVKQNGNVVANLESPAFIGVPTAPTAVLSTNTTQIATTAFVKSKSEADSIGVGQTLQDVTTSRASGVTYTNSTGKPIQVVVEAMSSTASTFTINGVAQARYVLSCNYIVPNGATYSSVTSSGLAKWVELR